MFFYTMQTYTCINIVYNILCFQENKALNSRAYLLKSHNSHERSNNFSVFLCCMKMISFVKRKFKTRKIFKIYDTYLRDLDKCYVYVIRLSTFIRSFIFGARIAATRKLLRNPGGSATRKQFCPREERFSSADIRWTRHESVKYKFIQPCKYPRQSSYIYK